MPVATGRQIYGREWEKLWLTMEFHLWKSGKTVFECVSKPWIYFPDPAIVIRMSFAASTLTLIWKQLIPLPSALFTANLTSIILHTTSFHNIKYTNFNRWLCGKWNHFMLWSGSHYSLVKCVFCWIMDQLSLMSVCIQLQGHSVSEAAADCQCCDSVLQRGTVSHPAYNTQRR